MSLLKVAGTTASSGTLYVDDVFSTWLYTGNGSTQTITNGIDLAGKGGLVWIKSRSAATDHKLTDTVRGVTKALISSTIGVETTDSTGLTAFSSTGFSIGTDSVYNTNAATYASWTFRKQPKFFDVVTYTGNGANRTIAHNLGSVPGCIIVKRTDATGGWGVYHNGLTSAAYRLLLNSAAIQVSDVGYWNSTNPTSTVFSIGNTADVNASGGTYIAYIFAHNSGGFGLTGTDNVISCGSFTVVSGAASVTLGYEPQFIMYKNKSGTSDDWTIMDNMRGFNSATYQPALFPNKSNAESFGYALANATGFTTSGATDANYIYIAIRRPNKPPTTGTQVFSPVASSSSGNQTTNFPVDMMMIGDRNGVNYGAIFDFDRLRGNSPYLTTQSTAAESIALGSSPVSFTSSNANTGFSETFLGAVSKIYWTFNRAPGFFDEVCYTGAPTAYSGRSISHNLGAVPELAIFKARSAAATSWSVGGFNNCDGTGLILNTTAAFNASGPLFGGATYNTATSMYIRKSTGASFDVDASGVTYVAYLFATLAGISKVGSYTGNGTGQAIACGFGSSGARFVLIKRTDSTGDWYTYDSARGLTSGSSPYLLLNSTAAEVTGNNGVYASSGGFTLGATAITTTNIATATYIFLAVA